MVIMISIIGGIACWVLYSGLKQNEEIGKFTVDVAEPLPMAELNMGDRTALQKKLTEFKAGGADDEEIVLKLSIQELNDLVVLAAEAGIADYRGMVKFTGVDADQKVLLADLCWPINRLSLKDQSKRYLVGQASFEPYLENGSMDLRIIGLKVPGKEVNQGFLKSLGQWPWLNLAKLNSDVAEMMKRVVNFEFDAKEGLFILKARSMSQTTNPSEEK